MDKWSPFALNTTCGRIKKRNHNHQQFVISKYHHIHCYFHQISSTTKGHAKC